MTSSTGMSRRHAVGVAVTTVLAPIWPSQAAPAPAPPAMTPDALIAALRPLVDADGLLIGDAIGKRYLARGQQDKPIVVVRPRTTAEVSAIMKLCSAARQPVVPQGGMSGLVGGGVARKTELALSFERMTAIEDLNVADRTMTVGAGVILSDAQTYAADRGFLVPIDFGARAEAMIGGIVSTNAGGEEVVRYGMTRESILGLEVVLADGTVVSSLNRLIKNNAGYDLKHMFIGSEGTLGLVTRAVLRLRRRQDGKATAFVALDRPEAVSDLLRHLDESLGGGLTKFEIMWSDYDEFVRKYCPQLKPPLKAGHACYVLTESTGQDAREQRSRLSKALDQAKRQGAAANFIIAKDEAAREAFWDIREQAGGAFGKLGPFFGYDVSLSVTEMPTYVAKVKGELAAAFPGCTTLVLGHVGDGNLHLIVAPGSRAPEVHHRANDIIYGAIRDLRGSVSAEHGIGTEKKDYLAWCRSPEEIALMRSLKVAMDPFNLLNPGKVI